MGTITAVGEGVNELAMGDRVMSLGRTNWAEEIQVSSGAVVKVPKDADVQQLSMLKVNPATATGKYSTGEERLCCFVFNREFYHVQ